MDLQLCNFQTIFFILFSSWAYLSNLVKKFSHLKINILEEMIMHVLILEENISNQMHIR